MHLITCTMQWSLGCDGLVDRERIVNLKINGPTRASDHQPVLITLK